MKRLRRVIFWCHLFTGTIAGVIVLIMSVTGVILTYEKQITNWADTRNYRIAVPSPTAQRLSLEILLSRISEARDSAPTSLTVRSDPNSPVAIGFAGGRTVFVNPYTAEVLGEGAPRVRAFFRGVTDWHRWLGRQGESRNIARAITGACNLGFLFLVISGFYLWWPSTWTPRFLRSVVWFKRGLPARSRNFNWHNTIGFWCAVPLFIVVLSSVVISYTWAGNLVYRVVGETPPAPRTAPAKPTTKPDQKKGETDIGEPAKSLSGLGMLWTRAEQQVSGWKSIGVQLPLASDGPVTFTIDVGNGGQPQKRAQLTLDRKSADVIRWEPFSSLTLGRRLRSVLRFAHTGEVAGIVGQTIAGIASAGGGFLVWTGLSLSLRRLNAWRSRRRKKNIGNALESDEASPTDSP